MKWTVALLLLTAGVTAVSQVGDSVDCDSERVAPNLKLNRRTNVRGVVKDEQTAPIPKSKIELRKYSSEDKQTSFRSALTDEKGHFDLGILPPGSYRLLAAPHRGFAQPEKMECWDKSECTLEIVLKSNPTDLPYSQCPLR